MRRCIIAIICLIGTAPCAEEPTAAIADILAQLEEGRYEDFIDQRMMLPDGKSIDPATIARRSERLLAVARAVADVPAQRCEIDGNEHAIFALANQVGSFGGIDLVLEDGRWRIGPDGLIHSERLLALADAGLIVLPEEDPPPRSVPFGTRTEGRWTTHRIERGMTEDGRYQDLTVEVMPRPMPTGERLYTVLVTADSYVHGRCSGPKLHLGDPGDGAPRLLVQLDRDSWSETNPRITASVDIGEDLIDQAWITYRCEEEDGGIHDYHVSLATWLSEPQADQD